MLAAWCRVAARPTVTSTTAAAPLRVTVTSVPGARPTTRRRPTASTSSATSSTSTSIRSSISAIASSEARSWSSRERVEVTSCEPGGQAADRGRQRTGARGRGVEAVGERGAPLDGDDRVPRR